MKNQCFNTALAAGCIALWLTLAAGQAAADWNTADGYKMHFPQLPDPNGWDVTFEGDHPLELADDWQCSETGPVKDIHFWVSFEGHDNLDPPPLSGSLTVAIYFDAWSVPEQHSMPGEELWTQQFEMSDVTIRHAGTGTQGWHNPDHSPPEYTEDDHTQYFQINIADISDPFSQAQDTIYWLGIQMPDMTPQIGWKTSLDHWNDDACFRWAAVPAGTFSWDSGDMQGPGGESLDLAFVITPEPATLLLLSLGGLGVLLKRRAQTRTG